MFYKINNKNYMVIVMILLIYIIY